MTRRIYEICDYPSGRVLDAYYKREDARDTIAAWEDEEMINGTYTPGCYYIRVRWTEDEP